MLVMSVDDYVISQFSAINASLSDIQTALRGANSAVGRIEGVQKEQARTIERVERRLNDVTKDTQGAVNDLKRTTGEIEVKLGSLVPKPKGPWYREAMTADNVKLVLLIVMSVIAIVAGSSAVD